MWTDATISPDWIDWISTNYKRGVDVGRICDILVDRGLERSFADRQVGLAISTVQSQSESAVDGQVKKLESFMAAYSALRSQCQLDGIDRESGLKGEQFFRWYYATNTPVVLRDQMNTWPALDKWGVDYFETYYGEEMVEVMSGRNSDPAYEINCAQHKTSMRMSQYVDMVRSVEETNDFYMVANNRSIEGGNLRYLLDDIRFFDGILDADSAASKLFLWFGPAGTVTPLHYDVMNVLLAQVMGRKKVTLIPSFQTPLMYNEVGVYSKVDLEAPDYLNYPLFKRATPIEVFLEPGEALFIPVGWWHHVRSLDVSISASFINFAVGNSYGWNEESSKQ